MCFESNLLLENKPSKSLSFYEVRVEPQKLRIRLFYRFTFSQQVAQKKHIPPIKNDICIGITIVYFIISIDII